MMISFEQQNKTSERQAKKKLNFTQRKGKNTPQTRYLQTNFLQVDHEKYFLRA
jgi:hypothetical protein